MHGMVRRDVHIAWAIRDYRQGKPFGQRFQGGNRRPVLTHAGGDDQRIFRRRKNFRRFIQCIGIRRGSAGRHPTGGRLIGKIARLFGQHLARQRQVDWAPGFGHGNGYRAIDNGFDLLAVAQFVIPFDHFAQG